MIGRTGHPRVCVAVGPTITRELDTHGIVAVCQNNTCSRASVNTRFPRCTLYHPRR